MSINSRIEKPYIRKAYIYLAISILTLLCTNLLIFTLGNSILFEFPVNNISSYFMMLSAFYLVLTLITIWRSLKRNHIELFANIKNDSLTYFFLPLLILLVFFKKYLFNLTYVIIFMIGVTLITKLSMFSSIFFVKKNVKTKSEISFYAVLFTVLILSILSIKGIDLNTKLYEFDLPPIGIEIRKDIPEYTLTPENPIDSDGLILVSYLGSANNVPQGTLIAHVRIYDKSGAEYVFSLYAGVETSELGFGFPSVGPYINHKQAKIYNRRLSNVGGVDYIVAYEYKQRFNFEKPIQISSINFQFVVKPDFPDPAKLVISKLFSFKNKRTNA
jgi:hypothetical protein